MSGTRVQFIQGRHYSEWQTPACWLILENKTALVICIPSQLCSLQADCWTLQQLLDPSKVPALHAQRKSCEPNSQPNCSPVPLAASNTSGLLLRKLHSSHSLLLKPKSYSKRRGLSYNYGSNSCWTFCHHNPR